MAAKARVRDLAQRRRRVRREADATASQWEVLRVAGAETSSS